MEGNFATTKSRKWSHAPALLFCYWVTACASSGFRIENLATAAYPPAASVDLVHAEPQRPYLALAKFSGAELKLCATDNPYCGLREQARAVGADAVWIQRTQTSRRPEQWVNINGRMTRIPPADYETVEGLFIRYQN